MSNDVDASREHLTTLWQSFPKTILEFEEKFATEEACRDYLIECRWGGKPSCARCGNQNLWLVHDGRHFECSDKSCRHQTSITAGTLFHRTRKPLRLWFRAIWEICVHRHGISAKDLQRVLGLSKYDTAWTWAHRIRRAFVAPERTKLVGCAQIDETFVGGKGADKSIVWIAVEEGGRARLVHVPGTHKDVIKYTVETALDEETSAKSDGHAATNKKTLGDRPHDAKVQIPAERKTGDHLQLCHWMASNLKRWLRGTHHGAVSAKHLKSYLDEHTFRYNRRKTTGVGRLVARCLENMIVHQPLTMRQLIDETHECRLFEGVAY